MLLSAYLVDTTWETARDKYSDGHQTRGANNVTLESSNLKLIVISSLFFPGFNGTPTPLISTPRIFCVEKNTRSS